MDKDKEAEEAEEAGFQAIIKPRNKRANKGNKEDQVDDTTLPKLLVNEI